MTGVVNHKRRNLKNTIPRKNVFTAVIIAKKNAEDDLREQLEHRFSNQN